MSDEPLFTIVRGGDVYAPEHLGNRTLVIAAQRIVWLGRDDDLDDSVRRLGSWCNEIDARGRLLLPGFVDPHQHTLGGGGEQGFSSRMPEVTAAELLGAGITTSIGCLGTDITTRHLTSLVAKTRQLEEDGLSAYMLTGGFTVPPRAITGSIEEDIVIVDKVIGVGEVAVSDRRACDPSLRDLARLVTQAYRGGTLAGKAGVTLFHVGEGKARLQVLHALLDEHDVEPTSFVADHVNRTRAHVEESVELAQRGVQVCMDTVDGEFPRWLGMYRECGGPPERLSVCSDAHTANGDIAKLPRALVGGVRSGFPLADVLPAFTSNTADVWHLGNKGRIAPGMDADVLFVDPASLAIEGVMARGRLRCTVENSHRALA